MLDLFLSAYGAHCIRLFFPSDTEQSFFYKRGHPLSLNITSISSLPLSFKGAVSHLASLFYKRSTRAIYDIYNVCTRLILSVGFSISEIDLCCCLRSIKKCQYRDAEDVFDVI